MNQRVKNVSHWVSQNRLRTSVALIAALAIVFSLSTFAAPAKKVPNGQLSFRTWLPGGKPFPNQRVTFKCGGGQKTVYTNVNGQSGPFDVTSTNKGDKSNCWVKVFIPEGHELVTGNQQELTRTVVAGNKEIVNWNFIPPEPEEPADEPADEDESENEDDSEKDEGDEKDEENQDDDKSESEPTPGPPQVIIVPADPEGIPLDSIPDTGPAIPEPPANEPPEPFPPADEPIQDEPSTPEVESAPEDDTEQLGPIEGFSGSSSASSDPSATTDSGLSGSGSDIASNPDGLPGITPTPSADVAASRGQVPAWQQWLLVLLILGSVGALAYFGLKYYREHQA